MLCGTPGWKDVNMTQASFSSTSLALCVCARARARVCVCVCVCLFVGVPIQLDVVWEKMSKSKYNGVEPSVSAFCLANVPWGVGSVRGDGTREERRRGDKRKGERDETEVRKTRHGETTIETNKKENEEKRENFSEFDSLIRRLSQSTAQTRLGYLFCLKHLWRRCWTGRKTMRVCGVACAVYVLCMHAVRLCWLVCCVCRLVAPVPIYSASSGTTAQLWVSRVG